MGCAKVWGAAGVLGVGEIGGVGGKLSAARGALAGKAVIGVFTVGNVLFATRGALSIFSADIGL
jgi:hypothetical protein